MVVLLREVLLVVSEEGIELDALFEVLYGFEAADVLQEIEVAALGAIRISPAHAGPRLVNGASALSPIKEAANRSIDRVLVMLQDPLIAFVALVDPGEASLCL